MSPAPFLLIRDLDCDLDRHPVDGVRPFRNRGHRAAAAADWQRTLRNSGPNLGSVNIATAAATAADWQLGLQSSGPNLGSANIVAATADWRLGLRNSGPNLGSAPAAAAPVAAAFAVPLQIRLWRRRLVLP